MLTKRFCYIPTCLPGIWQHTKALTLPKITFIASGLWSCLGGPTQRAMDLHSFWATKSLDSHSKT